MSDKDDPVLLREYVESGSEDAFATLVRRYVDLVYSAACRMTNNPHLAQEVTQCVFAALSANARRLTARRVLSGWLHRTAQNLAAKAVRTEVRRRAREMEAAAMNQLFQSEVDPLWDQIAPHLDAALGNLRQADREVVLLRFFQGRSAREIAHALGLSEEAAQKRVARALDRLRLALAARHTAISAPALPSALIAHSVQAAPVGVTALALAGASNPAGATVGALAASLEFLGLSKLQIALLGLCFLMGSATPIMIDSASGRATRRVFLLPPDSAPFAAGSGTDRRADQAPHGRIESDRGPGLDRLEAWLRQAATHARGPVVYSDHIDQGEMQFLIWSLPATDYPEAWRLRERLESREIVNRFQHALLEFWAQLDPRAALEAASSLGGRWGRHDPALGVLAAWAEREPAAALSWIQMSLPKERQATALASVIPSAARSDPRLALAKLEELPPGHTRQTAFVDTVRGWAGQDPAAAALYVVGLPASKARSELLDLVASAWASMNPATAIDWAEGLSSTAEQNRAISGVIRGLAQARPTEAAALVNRLSENQPAACTPHIALIVNNWPASDLVAAANWLTKLPEGGGHHGAMLELFRRWGEQEPMSAAEFLKTLPAPESHGDSLGYVLSAWTKRDLAAALDWVVCYDHPRLL